MIHQYTQYITYTNERTRTVDESSIQRQGTAPAGGQVPAQDPEAPKLNRHQRRAQDAKLRKLVRAMMREQKLKTR